MKEIKQKPAGGKPKTADAARVPKAVVKAAWLQAREAARAGEKQVVGGKDGASHRLKIASKMNRIIYLENGKIVGIGTHQQLMTGCEKYRRYYVSWLLMEND